MCTPLMRTLVAALVLSWVLPACAQKQIVTISLWRVHAGDDPAWARPDFDDSRWGKISYRELDSFNDPGGTRWYRATFRVPADFATQDLALGMGPLDQVYDVYVEGVLVGQCGSWNPGPHGPFPRHIAFPLPAGLFKEPIAHIAIRRWRGKAGLHWLTFDLSGYMENSHPPEIGPQAAIDALELLHPAAGAIMRLPWTLTFVLFLFAAAVTFVLFSVQRRRVEYLYLGVYCILYGAPPLIAIPLATSNTITSQSWGPALLFSLHTLSATFALLFLATLCPQFRRVLQFGAILGFLAALASAYGLPEQSYVAAQIWMGWDSYGWWIFALLAAWGFFQDRSRGSFAIASCLLLNGAGWAWSAVAGSFQLPDGRAMDAGPFRIDLRSVPAIIFVSVTLLVLYLRYRDEQFRQAAIDQEMAGARKMQNQLLASGDEHPAGFKVDAVYRPAREVGGDFYRTVTLEDGSLLVIVGDVSGKGLDAAMLVALILGSLANETHRSPAWLLAYLNQAVLGRTAGGFITACCARFYPDGRVVLANAGQIAPYLDGLELQLESGLPLGISAESTYSETETRTNGTMTFVSDGVVEARDAKGELLGFERMGPLTVKSAEEIADAAQRWGQEDDITVLTVARAPKLEAVTA